MIGTIGEGLYELGVDEGDVRAAPRGGYGGDAANTAVMAARHGGARLCGRVGDDALGRLLLEFWRSSGVDTQAVKVDSAPTGIYVNERLRPGGCRFHYHRRGSAGSRLCAADITDAFLDGLDAVHYTGITLAISTSAASAARLAARRAREQGALVSFAFNYRPALNGDARELLACARAADVVFLSVEEARAVLATDEAEEVARALGAAPMEIVLTLGGGGATAMADGSHVQVEAAPVEVVDASGAGDALAAVYLAERIAGAAVEHALTQAVAAASLSCRSFGAALSYPEASELALPA
jgi:2-dehydro-3-deoxygluconokinase